MCVCLYVRVEAGGGLLDLKRSYSESQRSVCRPCRQTDGVFLVMLLNIATNAKDQRRSEATFHLRRKVDDKRRLTWLLFVAVPSQSQSRTDGKNGSS